MHPDTVFTYTMLTLGITLLFALIAMVRLIIEIRRDAAADRQKRSLWSQLFASARQWEKTQRGATQRAPGDPRGIL